LANGWSHPAGERQAGLPSLRDRSRAARRRAARSMRARSSVVRPGRRPSSTSARRTHRRRVSWWMSSFAAIDSIAFHCDGYSRWCSNTIRTARSRSSAGCLCPFGSAGIAPSSQEKEQSPDPGLFTGRLAYTGLSPCSPTRRSSHGRRRPVLVSPLMPMTRSPTRVRDSSYRLALVTSEDRSPAQTWSWRLG
jgi:hypothetical protein